MVIHDFDIFGAIVRPTETNAELIIHTNAVLTSAIAFQRLQPIAWRNPKILQPVRDLKLSQLASRDGSNVYKAFDPLAL